MRSSLAFIQVVKELAKIVELKSKVAPGRYTVEDLRLRLGYDTGEMRRSDYDPSIIEQHERFNARLEALLLHPVIGTYLRELTPQQPYQASGVAVHHLDGIKEEIQSLSPGAYIVWHGYLVFASNAGGNALCFHAPTGRVVWADHEMTEDSIMFKDPATGRYRELALTPENLEVGLPTVTRDIPTFLTDLLHDRLTDQLDSLD